MEQKAGKPPMLPLWLSPTHVRVIPVSESVYDHAEKVAGEIEGYRIRADWDDRPLTMQRKVRESEREWIPYTVVVGEKEATSGVLTVRDRRLGKVGKPGKLRNMKLEELTTEIKSEIKGKPFKPLSLSGKLSKRPRFFG